MNLDNVETFYPLSPGQQGILFHSVFDPASYAYFGQLGFTFFESIDVPAFERAWQQVIQRHPVLRTFFVWEGLKEPVQVIRPDVQTTIEQHDWRNMTEPEQRAKLEHFLQADRERGLDLTKAPLLRLTLIRLGEESCRFIWSHHHVVVDGWSAPLILNELLSLYVSYRRGEQLDLPAPRPYRDYIAWLAKQDVKKAEEYWRSLLKGFSRPTPLEIERKSGEKLKSAEAHTADGWEREIEVSPDLLRRLQEVGRKQRLTLNTIVQGAWAILLSKYSGLGDVVYGATVSGRPAELQGADEMVGLFINTLPARVRVRPDELLADLLKQIQDQQLETRQYEYSRLVDVQTWSEVERGSSLFDTIFVFENYPVKKLSSDASGSLKIDNVTFNQRTNYSLTFAAGLGTSLVLRILYDPRKYSGDSINHVLRHLTNLLEEFAKGPDRQINEIDILSAEEREQILRTWNETRTEYPGNTNVARLFEDQAEKNGEGIAVVGDSERLSYRELNERSNQLAHYLQAKGVGPEHVVGLCVDRGVGMVVGLLAILKAGGAYLPLDGSYPQERLNYMLTDTRARLVVTESRYTEVMSSVTRELVVMDEEWKEIASLSRERVAGEADSENLAYVIYTSGSTGQPKGVMVQHRSLSNLVRAQVEVFGITSVSCVLQFASFSFDASVSEIFSVLLTGATLHVTNPERLRPGMDLITVLRNRKITVVTLPPSILVVLADEDLPQLQTLVTAGEACSAEIVTRWAGGRRFINAYGPTETTVCATMSEPLQIGQPPTIGKPTANGQIFILDPSQHPVPVGIAGEIYVGGDLLARGYFNRPDLTAERFLPDPFSGEIGGRIYRTGDLARYLADGNIEYIGRIDHQVKLRGFRIEPGEIETVLQQHPGVSKAVVIVREDVVGDKRLVAYITAPGEPAINVKELQESLKSKLPAYMVPFAVIAMDAFPLTAAGKVDRQALPAPSSSRAESGSAYAAPRNQAERTIVQIWCNVLQLEKVGIHENFFDLGGHSLLMLQVHGKLKEAFEKDISVMQMFGYSTVSSLAEYFTQSETQTKNTNKSVFSSIQERVNRQREARKQQAAKHQDAPAHVEL